jgi:inorganic pyrophosphatase
MTGTGQHLRKLLTFFFQAHPWHGIPAESQRAKGVYHVFVELTPFDGVKYEVDKATGHIHCDRPQKYSNLCPTLYGFIPRTYCGASVGAFCDQQTGRSGIEGDGDPLDICVLSEKPISNIGILVHARPIGGLRMIDDNSADDKIIAVLEKDMAYGHLQDISELPPGMVDRLRQYFLTYKLSPDDTQPPVEITHVYDAQEAQEVVRRSQADYRDKFQETQADAVRFLQDLAETVKTGA